MIQTSRGECAHLPLNATQECVPVGREGSPPRLEALISQEMTSSLWISGVRVAEGGDLGHRLRCLIGVRSHL